MRSVGLALYSRKLSTDEIVNIARSDARLSHPHKTNQDCNALYILAITHLLKNPGDAAGAVALVDNYVDSHKNEIQKEVQIWLQNSKTPSVDILGNAARDPGSIGFIKHAFRLAFYFLRNKTHYETAINLTLTFNGDTDTNACIVGGMLGALWGYKAIPEYMRTPVLNFNPALVGENGATGRFRPQQYGPHELFDLVDRFS
jgi:ADP-ribosylglycohydrolase